MESTQSETKAHGATVSGAPLQQQARPQDPTYHSGSRRRRRAVRGKDSKIESFDGLNWRIHQLYTQQQYEACEQMIELALKKSHKQCEYALFVRGLLLKVRGQLKEAQLVFQDVLRLRPNNHHAAVQIARCLYLMGKFRAALDVFDQALQIGVNTWRLHHDKSLCYARLEQYDEAEKCLGEALLQHKNADSLVQLAKVRLASGDVGGAASAYEEALTVSAEDTAIMTELGLLYLRMGKTGRAFELFGACLTYDPRDTKAILAAASIIQDNEDYDVALVKYRISAVLTPESAELWNNIGMCFFGKQKHVAAIACLKRAAYLAPFEWMVAFNLGLVHLTVGQNASAFHFFSAAVNLRPGFGPAYGLLAVTLYRLRDLSNAGKAFEKSISMDENDPITRLNYAIMLHEQGRYTECRQQFDAFEALAKKIDDFQVTGGFIKYIIFLFFGGPDSNIHCVYFKVAFIIIQDLHPGGGNMYMPHI
eukprot:m.43974 g.43974  ORF g.43974 m.43974 type:complete len:478 (-) comp12071_c0_seq2:93-1526(-)